MLVTIIIPAHNRQELIGATLDSVREQVYRPIEIVVVDDGSTDGTPEAVTDWKRALPAGADLQIRCYRQVNRGAPAARNRGLALANGRFIQFLDSDDRLAPTKLRDQVRALKRSPRADFAFSRWEYFGEKIPGYSPYWAEDFRADRNRLINLMLQENRRHYLPLHTGSTLYRREFCRRLGGWDEDLRCYQDVVYNTRALVLAERFCYVPRVQMFARRTTGEHVSGPLASEEKARSVLLGLGRIRDILRQHGALSPHRRFLLGKALVFLAWGAFAAGAFRAGDRAVLRASRICPASSMRLVAGLTRLLSSCGAGRLAPQMQVLWKRVPACIKRAMRW